MGAPRSLGMVVLTVPVVVHTLVRLMVVYTLVQPGEGHEAVLVMLLLVAVEEVLARRRILPVVLRRFVPRLCLHSEIPIR